MNTARASRIGERGGVGTASAVGFAACRHHDDAEHGCSVLDERDIDRELTIAGKKLFGAVQRVDKPETRAGDSRRKPFRGGFLGYRRNVRRS